MARFGNLIVGGGPVSTVAAAIQTIASFDLGAATFSAAPDNVALYIEGVLTGRVVATGECVSMRIARSYKRIAGAVTALGAGISTLVPPIGDAAIVGAVGLLDAAGTTARLRVTGVLAFTIEWTGYLAIYSGEFTG